MKLDSYRFVLGLISSGQIAGLVILVFCRAHLRGRFCEITNGGQAPIAGEALQWVGALVLEAAHWPVPWQDRFRPHALAATTNS
jgi:hypothetical protein